MSEKSTVTPVPDVQRLTMNITAEDALILYQALHGHRFTDARPSRLIFLIEDVYAEAYGERLTEPWEWDD